MFTKMTKSNNTTAISHFHINKLDQETNSLFFTQQNKIQGLHPLADDNLHFKAAPPNVFNSTQKLFSFPLFAFPRKIIYFHIQLVEHLMDVE